MPETFKTGAGTQTDNLWKMIGSTPLIAIRYTYRGSEERELLVKCEQYNLTHSIKDRVVLYTLQRAKYEGQLKPGDLIADACSGNSGISLAAIGRALGHRVKIIMPDCTGMETRAAVKGHGAELLLIGAADGGFEACVKTAEAMSFHDGVFLPRKLTIACNVEAHERTTGREIGHYLLLERIKPDAFVAGVGTGGTLLGVGKYLTAMYPDVALYPVWAVEGNEHRISGYCQVEKAVHNMKNWVEISDGDAILMAQKLARSAGLPVGISSGANFLGAVKVQQQAGGKNVVLTIFPDHGNNYPALLQTESIKDGYLSQEIELLGYKVLEKV